MTRPLGERSPSAALNQAMPPVASVDLTVCTVHEKPGPLLGEFEEHTGDSTMDRGYEARPVTRFGPATRSDVSPTGSDVPILPRPAVRRSRSSERVRRHWDLARTTTRAVRAAA